MLENHKDRIPDLTIVLPGNRPILFFLKEFKDKGYAGLLPEFITIENLMIKISGLELISGVELYLQAYHAYHIPREKKPSFSEFIKWAPTLIDDFSDMDSQLIKTEDIFSYLQSLERIDKWGKSAGDLTELMTQEIDFWEKAKIFYKSLNKNLLKEGLAYRGAMYRQAEKEIPTYFNKRKEQLVFCGLNALTQAEYNLLAYAGKNTNALFYFDADKYYVDNPKQEAGVFLREYYKTFSPDKFNWVESAFDTPKEISLLSCSGDSEQAICAGEILATLSTQELDETLLVLADENLLEPVLYNLPTNIEALNVTMGYPAVQSNWHTFFSDLFKTHQTNQNRESPVYVKEALKRIITKLENSFPAPVWADVNKEINQEKGKIVRSQVWLNVFSHSVHNAILSPQLSNIDFINTILVWIEEVQSKLNVENRNFLALFYEIFIDMKKQVETYPFIENFDDLVFLYLTHVKSRKMAFIGEPLNGLQITGMLETRLLSFKRLIMLSVNEEVLPAGNTQNSFIPFEVRKMFKLKTFLDHDAIYAYHFYRLLQHSDQAYFIYNTDINAAGKGEESRFLKQLKIEYPYNIKQLSTDNLQEVFLNQPLSIEKTATVISKIKEWMARGVSPSAISLYKRNQIEFYKKYILGINQLEIDDEIKLSDIGTIVHKTLDRLYRPYINKSLAISDLTNMDTSIEECLSESFSEINLRDMSQSNFLVYESCKQMVENAILFDRKLIEKHKSLIILELETSGLKATIEIGKYEVSFKGDIDRLDSLDGTYRVVDYKTGNVKGSDLSAKDIGGLVKKDKVLQLLIYQFLTYQNKPINEIEPWIYPLRYSNASPYTVTLAKNTYHPSKEDLIQVMAEMETIFDELLDASIPFQES